MDTHETDILIVGQGIAGSCIAAQLWQHHKKCIIINQLNTHTASYLAAGLLNPHTGKRFAPVPHYETLFRFAKHFYMQLSAKWTIPLFREIPIVIDPSAADIAEHITRRAVANSDIRAFEWGQEAQKAFYYTQAAQLNVPLLLDTVRHYAQQQQAYYNEPFHYNELYCNDQYISYRHIRAQYIIFCEGIGVDNNPYWQHLSTAHTKGELLHVAIPGASKDVLLKQKHWIAPLHTGLFWVGASNEWHYENDEPSDSFYRDTKAWLQTYVNIPFSIVDHLAAIRPTMRNRLVYYAQHPQWHRMAILNGLGTKGSLWGPYYANQLLQQLQIIPEKLV